MNAACQDLCVDDTGGGGGQCLAERGAEEWVKPP